MPSPKAPRFTGAQVRCRADGATIRVANTRSAQGGRFANILWGWAGGNSNAGMELYGRACGDGRGSRSGCWEWDLTEDGVAELRRGLSMMEHDPKRFGASRREGQMAGRLRAALGACG